MTSTTNKAATAAIYVSRTPPSEATASATVQQAQLEIAHRKAIVRTPVDSIPSPLDSIRSSKRSSIALLLHGGCFTAGDHTWNAQQAEALTSELKIITVTFDFRTTCLQETMSDLLECIDYLRRRYSPVEYSLGVIGCSSAGYFALQLAQQLGTIDYVIALCPVFDPAVRFRYLQDGKIECDSWLSLDMRTKMQKQQLVYWQTEQNMIDAAQQLRQGKYKVPTLAIFGNSDANVPPSMALQFCEQVVQHDDRVAVACLEGGHDLCSKPNKLVQDEIAQFIASCASCSK